MFTLILKDLLKGSFSFITFSKHIFDSPHYFHHTFGIIFKSDAEDH